LTYEQLNIANSTLSNIFIGTFFFTGLLILLNYYAYPKRYRLNISRPNIYIFEYETQILNQFSFYNIINSLVYLLTLLLIYMVFVNFLPEQHYNFSFYNKLLGAFILFLLLKKLLSLSSYFFIKNYKILSKMHFITGTYNTYLIFYLFLLSFLAFYFPFKSMAFFYVIVFISIIWILYIWASMYSAVSKHTDIKSYQLFLYLCLSEILPLILLTGWISFQII